jgi:hypothetical protein
MYLCQNFPSRVSLSLTELGRASELFLKNLGLPMTKQFFLILLEHLNEKLIQVIFTESCSNL